MGNVNIDSITTDLMGRQAKLDAEWSTLVNQMTAEINVRENHINDLQQQLNDAKKISGSPDTTSTETPQRKKD